MKIRSNSVHIPNSCLLNQENTLFRSNVMSQLPKNQGDFPMVSQRFIDHLLAQVITLENTDKNQLSDEKKQLQTMYQCATQLVNLIGQTKASKNQTYSALTNRPSHLLSLKDSNNYLTLANKLIEVLTTATKNELSDEEKAGLEASSLKTKLETLISNYLRINEEPLINATLNGI